jgi:hypothetical protein
MNHSQTNRVEKPRSTTAAGAIRDCEQRLDALCDLIDEELRTGAIGDCKLSDYARRITGEVDQAMAEETNWCEAGEFLG